MLASRASGIDAFMLSRRSILRGALAAIPLSFLWNRRARAAGYGPLVPDPDGILDLPAGFTYRVVDRRGDTMSDGYRTPGLPDGMACFAGAGGTLVLLRNHELSNSHAALGPVGPGSPAPAHRYDPASHGGVTRVVVDGTTLARVSSNLVLYGTIRNCAGGPSPWGWLSCEEDTSSGHGYVFACAPTAAAVAPPQRITAYGRMNHEAVAVDPVTLIAYLTEDRGDGCFYRFVPASPATPWQGQLQALRVVGTDRFDTSAGRAVGDQWPIAWVDIATPDPAGDTLRVEARGRGAATVNRGEGLWFHDGAVYFTATGGGPAGAGQVFRLDPAGDGGALTLIAQSTGRDHLDGPDNLTVAPWGEVFLCEDGDAEQLIRVLGADGALGDFARNAASDGEFAGACFSPDGRVLFVNLQVDGLTLAITGPFPQPPRPEPEPEPEPEPDADPDRPDPGGGDGGEPGGGCSAGGDAGAGAAAVAAVAAATTAARAALR